MKMKSGTATVRERRKGRCMRTAKGMHAKIHRKVTKCYSGRRETIRCQHHSNNYLLQLFRKMETVFSLGADGVQNRRNVTHVKRYPEREDLKPKAESLDAIGDRDLAANL